MSFRFDHLNRLGNRVAVPIPTDEDGYLGRECPRPDCEGYFKIKAGTGLQGENLPCYCPYCGHEGSADDFWTKAQIEYAKSVVLRDVTRAIQKDLKQLELEYKPRGPFGIGLSVKVKHGGLPPIRYYREQALETRITCDQCALEYSVFGVFAYCPDCAVHNSLQILQKNLDLTRKQLDMAEALDERDLRQHLIDDALENCVSSFDAFGREACRVRSAKAADPGRCESLSFQNLHRAAQRLHDLFGIDLSSSVPATEWATAHVGFMRRHLVAHRAGVIDQQYLDATGELPALLGRRLMITVDEVRGLVEIVKAIARALIAMLPSPR